MANIPNSTIHLINVSLDQGYNHTLHFSDKEAQITYFLSKRISGFSFNDYKFVRHDNSLKVPKKIDELNAVNYAMYSNENKWYFAFIKDREFISEGVTRLILETDVIQTWIYDLALRECFVEREHVADDTIGAHLVDEGLETGEYITYGAESCGALDEIYNVIAVSDNGPMGNSEQIGNLYGNIVCGLTYYAFPNNSNGITWLKGVISAYNNVSKIDAIAMIFTVPGAVFSGATGYSPATAYQTNTPVPGSLVVGGATISIDKNLTDLDGYTPENNKLFTAPYNFLYVSNNCGGYAKYEYEKETGGYAYIQFGLRVPMTPNPKVILYPYQYDSVGINYEESLTLEGYPLGSWSNDTFTAWFNSNLGSTVAGLVSTGATVGGAIGSFVGGVGAVGGAVVGAVVGVAGTMGTLWNHYTQPDNARGNIGSGSLKYSIDQLDFTIFKKGIRAEYAQRIDKFFSTYGYKVNTFKVPDLTTRLYYNYIKTITFNCVGQVPVKDKEKIAEVFNKGITFWHDPAYFLSYGVTNSIRGD